MQETHGRYFVLSTARGTLPLREPLNYYNKEGDVRYNAESELLFPECFDQSGKVLVPSHPLHDANGIPYAVAVDPQVQRAAARARDALAVGQRRDHAPVTERQSNTRE